MVGAGNTSPHPALRFVVRTLLSLERAVPTFVTMLILQIAVGIGAFSTVLAIVLGTVGMFGKIFAEDLESVDIQPVEAIAAIGGSRLQQLRYGILPAARDSLISHWLYAFDINVRIAIALGVFGGGGIGFELYMSQRLLRHRDMLALVLVILVLVMATERVSDRLRRRLTS